MATALLAIDDLIRLFNVNKGLLRGDAFEPYNDENIEDDTVCDRADSPEWVDYKKNKELKKFKESLPLSINKIVEWANRLIGYNQVIDLDFDEIDKDLKYQYQKHNGDKQKLKEIFFNFNYNNPNDNTTDYDVRYCQLFGKDGYTLIHCLFYQLFAGGNCYCKFQFELYVDDMNKIAKQVLIMLRLLIKNKIIDVNDTSGLCQDYRFGVSIWDNVKFVLEKLHSNKRMWDTSNGYVYHCKDLYKMDILNEAIGLVLDCINQKNFDKQEGIVQVVVDESDDTIVPSIWIERDYDDCLLFNMDDVIERLLFRGVFPFHFVSHGMNNTLIMMQPIGDYDSNTGKYIQGILNKQRVSENINGKNEYSIYRSQMAVLCPLVFVPHLNRAKSKMNKLLTECITKNYIQNENISVEVSRIVSLHLFVQYEKFYNEEIQNNLNVRSLSFLNEFILFTQNQKLAKYYEECYADNEFVIYFVDNYLNVFLDFMGPKYAGYHFIYPKCRVCPLLIIGFICNLIKTYNENSHDKFPLKSVYDMIEFMMKSDDISMIKYIDFIKFINKEYKDEFNINFKDIYGDTMVTCHAFFRSNRQIQIANYVFKEFKDKYDFNNPCLLYKCFEYKSMRFFRYLIKKYGDLYPLSKICQTMVSMINDAVNHTRFEQDELSWKLCMNDTGAYLKQNERSQKFLKSFKTFCLSSICKNDQDKNVLHKCLNQVRKCYEAHLANAKELHGY